MKIPTCRELSAAFEVSVPVAMEALQSLASRGILVKQGTTGRYRRTGPRDGDAVPGESRLLLVRPSWIPGLGMFTQRVVDRLDSEASASGWTVTQETFSGSHERRRPDRTWDEAVARVKPTRIISVAGSAVLGRWAMKTGVPTLFLGGSAKGSRIPTLGVSFSALLRQLLPRLLVTGEQRICLPLCGYDEAYIAALRRAFDECLSAAGLPFVPTYHAPATTGRDGTALRNLLEPVMAAKPPSTLIFLNHRHYLGAFGLIARAGLIPGKSLKVAVLRHEDDLDWLDPRPAHFSFPIRRFWKLTKQWLQHPGADLFQQDEIDMPVDFIPGCGIE